MTATREAFLKAPDFKIKSFPIGGSEFHVRTLSLNRLKDLRAYESRDEDDAERKNRAAVGLATLALCDRDGAFLFDLEDVNFVCGKTPDTVVAIANAAADVQATAEDVAAAKRFEGEETARWEMRVGALLRLTPREVRGRLTPHDLAEYKAWAEVDGPWWGVRLDVLFARQQATTAAAAGVRDVSPDQFLVRWGRSAPALVVPFEDVVPILRARFGT